MGEVIETFAWMSRLEGPVGALRQRGPADPFVAAMRRSREPTERLALAFRALQHDEDCIEANLVVAGSCSDVNRRLLYLNIAVEAGESLWGQIEHRYDIGAMPGITPWLRSLKALGQTLEGVGDLDSAADCYRRLGQFDHDDHFQVHASLERLAKHECPTL